METLAYLSLMIGLALYFHYVVRRIRPVLLRAFFTAIGCLVILVLPLNLQQFRLGTMVACSAAFMACLQLQYLMFYTDDVDRSHWSFVDFIRLVQQALLPVSYVPPEKRRSFRHLARDSAFLVLRGSVELFITNVLWMWLVSCLGGSTKEVEESYWLDVIYSNVFFLHMMTGSMCSFNIQRALLSMFSLDSLSLYQYYCEPLLACSPRDFWSRRWNLVLRNVLHSAVFTPARAALGSPALAAFLVFVVSGVLHVYLVWVVFGYRMTEAFVFFLLHGLACFLETVCVRKLGRLSKPFCNILTLAYCAWLNPLYMGTFMRASPQWLPNNAPDVILQIAHRFPLPACPTI